MCHGDTTLGMYEWWDHTITPYPQNVIHGPHVCAKWDRLSSWAVGHSFQPWGDIVVHPDTGKLPRSNMISHVLTPRICRQGTVATEEVFGDRGN